MLIPNTRKVALTSYAVWANYLGLIAWIAPELIYYFTGIDTNPHVWWSMAGFLILAGTVGRFIAQPGSSWAWRIVKMTVAAAVLLVWAAQAFAMGERPKRPVSTPVAGVLAPADSFLAVGVPYVGKWEGLRLEAYLDRIASPPVWTVCYGETKGISGGMSFSKRQCDDMLARELLSYRSRLHVAFTDDTKAKRLPVHRDVAYTSLAYNAGVSAISKSTAVRRLNAGDIAGGCEAIGWWNKAGGRIIRGLVNRRTEDVARCMIGVAA
jgi:GH24 family phage-related lysozyme (muramidase)